MHTHRGKITVSEFKNTLPRTQQKHIKDALRKREGDIYKPLTN